MQLEGNNNPITIFYDGGCQQCVKDMHTYTRWTDSSAHSFSWVDITQKNDLLQEFGIDPQEALMVLHVQDEKKQTFSEMDAYILLLKKIPHLRPLAWLIGRPLIRRALSRLYQRWTYRRLADSGRLPT